MIEQMSTPVRELLGRCAAGRNWMGSSELLGWQAFCLATIIYDRSLTRERAGDINVLIRRYGETAKPAREQRLSRGTFAEPSRMDRGFVPWDRAGGRTPDARPVRRSCKTHRRQPHS